MQEVNASSTPELHALAGEEPLRAAGLRASLYKHQQEGVSWMLRTELQALQSERDIGEGGGGLSPAVLPPLWQRKAEVDGDPAGPRQFCDVITNRCVCLTHRMSQVTSSIRVT